MALKILFPWKLPGGNKEKKFKGKPQTTFENFSLRNHGQCPFACGATAREKHQ